MTDLIKVSGVGPKAVERLTDAGITSAEELSKASVEKLVAAGFSEKMANKIQTAANLLLETEDTAEPVTKPAKKKPAKKKAEKVVEEPVAEDKKPAKKKAPAKKVKEPVEEKKPAKKPKKTKKDEKLREDQRSPVRKGIPTKKKGGVQVRSTDEVEAKIEKVDRGEIGWGVVARTLTDEEREERQRRLEAMNRAAKITRPIPTKSVPVKAKKVKKSKSEKPVKLAKEKKEVKLKKKKVKKVVEYYSNDDLFPLKTGARMRGVSSKASGESKPRIELKRDTLIGRISSHRRSRRVIHKSQLIVDIALDGVAPDQLVGQKVYFTYPDTSVKIPGSISKKFGKTSSRKVLVNFKKGIREEGIHQNLFIK